MLCFIVAPAGRRSSIHIVIFHVIFVQKRRVGLLQYLGVNNKLSSRDFSYAWLKIVVAGDSFS